MFLWPKHLACGSSWPYLDHVRRSCHRSKFTVMW